MNRHPIHLERLGIYRPGLPTLPIMPPKHVWMVCHWREMPQLWRYSRAVMWQRSMAKS